MAKLARPNQKKSQTQTRVERVGRTRLSQADYETLCATLARITPFGFRVGLGRIPRSATSQRALAERYGVSQQIISKIAIAVREGKAHRLYGQRVMLCCNGRYIARAPLAPPPTPSTPPIVPPSFGILDVAAMWEP